MINPLPNLLLITDRTHTLGRSLLDVLKAALEGGVKLIQLREKDLNGKELFYLAKKVRELTDGYGAKLLINDRVDIALAVGADGVHLGQQSVSVIDVRRAFNSINNSINSNSTGTVPILRQDKALSVNRDSPLPHPSSFIIGVSTHSVEEALHAQSNGADFITFGPVYFTPSKAAYGEPLGIDKLREVSKAVAIPIYALGGVKKGNIGEVLCTGAYGVAMISAITAAAYVKGTTKSIIEAINDR